MALRWREPIIFADKEFNYTIASGSQHERLDKYLAAQKGLTLSRSQIQKLIEDGQVRVNDQLVPAKYQLKIADQIKVIVPPPPVNFTQAEAIPLAIIYEDNDLIVINKPRGLVTHPAPGNRNHTLVNALLAHCDHLASLGAPLRPGIVHRLDKDTSGLIVVAKTDPAYLSLVQQLKERTMEKSYLALVNGAIKNEQGSIEVNIGRHPVNRKKMAVQAAGNRGKTAYSEFRVIKRFEKYTLVEVIIKTGRTHQIRVHLSHLGHPVVGDQVYGKKDIIAAKGQLLHAYKLSLTHPESGQRLSFTAPLPADMAEIISRLK